MVKRSSVLSDEEHDDPTSPSLPSTSTSHKRARLDSPLPRSSPPPLPPPSGDDDDDFDPAQNGDDPPSDDGMDEDEVDTAAEAQRLRDGVAAMRRTQRKDGLVAQAGVIEQVTLHNFMCHTYCEIVFGPQINFLVGNNGSGKSAVLTGISMALGGNAKATNRAGKGSGLVKDGAPHAICQVKLKNQGVDAFRPKDYGKSITIERRINRDMGGSYKIKDATGRVVDSKRATLDAILDHFNIQVDNPMTVLTQDQSRQFLANASPKDKYNFFLKGTQLAQLTEEYEVIRANTETMQAALDKKREVIPELKDAYKRAKVRWQEAEAASSQKDKVAQLEHELAWAYVVEVEDKIAESQDLISKEQRTAAKIKERLVTYRENLAEASEAVATLEEAMQENTVSTADTDAELVEINSKVAELRADLKTFGSDERDASNAQKHLQSQLEGYEKQLAEEQAKLQRNASLQRQPIQDEIARLQQEQTDASMAATDAASLIDKVDEQMGELNVKYRDLKDKIQGVSDAINQTKARISNVQMSRKNVLLAYHQQMPKLVEQINREKSWSVPPLGPIGSYVKLKDPRYTKALEGIFGHTLNGFVVETDRDKATLNRIMKSNNMSVPIIKAERDPGFDCSSGEPASDITTIRRVLEFKDPLIDQVLIVASHIEAAALVVHRAEGDRLMRSRPHNVETCFSSDLFRLGGGPGGGSSSTAIDLWRGDQRLSPDVSNQVAALEQELRGHEQKHDEFSAQLADVNRQLSDLHQSSKAHKAKQANMSKRVNQINNQIGRLIEQLNAEEPSNIGAIEDNMKACAADLRNIQDQFAALLARKAEVAAKVNPLVHRRGEIEDANKKVSEQRRKLSTKIEAAVTKRTEAESNIQQYEARLATQLDKILDFEKALEKTQVLLESRKEQASTICERPKVDRNKKKSVQRLTNEIESLQKALKERERRQGATLEQIMDEYNVRKKTAEEAVKVTNDLGQFIAVLAAAYTSRLERWTDFRDQISTRAKMQFIFHLSQRGFTGKLQFNHDKMRLDLRVQTDEAANGSTQNRQKDAKSLSGGEKSFSTICLLLTMWEAVGCPLRCLDEFDVFMDAVNRRISMKMMVDTAKCADSTQFILITPQAMGEIKFGPEVRVSRMVDPGRNQGTLAFGT